MKHIYARAGIRGGSVEHYYHFLVDYLIPIWYRLSGTNNQVLTKHDVNGFLKRHIPVILGGLAVDGPEPDAEITIGGIMSIHFVYFRSAFQAFADEMRSKASVTPESKYITFVKRLPTPEYHVEMGRESGSTRRNIVNQEELIETLRARFGETLRIACFEEMEFLDQVRLCAESSVMIGLHGAGLANLIFMPEGSRVVEIHSQVSGRLHFERLAAVLGKPYFREVHRLVGSGNKKSLEWHVEVNKERLVKTVEYAYGREAGG